MSDEALKQFEQVPKDQLDRNEARRMRTLVNQARGDTHGAVSRWPFELTQNAHDPGPRDGKADVDIDLTFDGRTVLYEHDGKPFTMQDLAALLSGGSNKDFDSIVDQLRKETDASKRNQLAIQANDLLIKDVAVIPLINRTFATSGIAKSLKGVDPSPWDSEMYNIADWSK